MRTARPRAEHRRGRHRRDCDFGSRCGSDLSEPATFAKFSRNCTRQQLDLVLTTGELMKETIAFLFPESENQGCQPRIELDPEKVKKGLGQLVLTLVELIRQLLEKQALRRIEGGTLTEREIEQLGLTFLALNEQMTRLKQEFGLCDEDLNLDLGPLGKLL